MTVLSPNLSIDDLELAWLKEDFAEGWGKTGVRPVVAQSIVDYPLPTKFVSGVDIGKIGWTTDRWFGVAPAAGNYRLLEGDTPFGVTNFIRKTWTVGTSSTGSSGDTGFGHLYGSGLNYDSFIPVTPGEKIFISSWLRTSASNKYRRFEIYTYTDAGVSVRDSLVSTPLSPNVWDYQEAEYTVPAGVAYINPFSDTAFPAGSTAWNAGDTFDATGLTIIRGGKPSIVPGQLSISQPFGVIYIDRNTIGDLEFSYWSKRSSLNPKEKFSLSDHMLNVLRSQYKAVAGDPITISRKNIVHDANPVTLEGWNSSLGGGSGGSVSLSIQSSNPPSPGLSYLESLITSLGTSTYASINVKDQFWATVVPNTPYSQGDVWVKCSSADRWLNIILQWFTADAVFISDTSVGVNSNGDWQLLSNLNKNSPPNASLFRFAARISGGIQVGDTLSLCKPHTELSSTYQGNFNPSDPNVRNVNGFLEMTDPSKHGITDLKMAFYINGSGLTPANKYSMADHEIMFYKKQLGLV